MDDGDTAETPQQQGITPDMLPAPQIELTFPAAIMQFHAAEQNGKPVTVLTVISKEDIRHYPMSPAYAQGLAAQIAAVGGAPKLEVVGPAQAPPGLRAV